MHSNGCQIFLHYVSLSAENKKPNVKTKKEKSKEKDEQKKKGGSEADNERKNVPQKNTQLKKRNNKEKSDNPKNYRLIIRNLSFQVNIFLGYNKRICLFSLLLK